MCNIQSVFCHPSFLPRSMQPQNAPKGCLNRIGLSNTPAGPRCVRRAGGHAHAHAHAQGLQGSQQLPCTMSSSKGSQRCRLRRTGPSASGDGGGRRAVGARSRAAAAALRLDLLHGPALDRPAVDEAGREALRGRRPRSAARRARRGVRLCGVCDVWCVACDGGGGEGQGAPARSRRPPPRRRGPS